MTQVSDAYEFVFRGLLADEALDAAGRKRREFSGVLDADLAASLSTELLDEDLVASARRMATVYTAVAAFENNARDLVSTAMLDAVGADWWDTCVSTKVRGRAQRLQDEDEKYRFHKQRGGDPITYTTLGDLNNIVRANYEDVFEAFFPSPEWVTSTFDAIERSRNVIMHSGSLDPEDVERVGIHVRDWVKQVGA